jgi:hypothetical protein
VRPGGEAAAGRRGCLGGRCFRHGTAVRTAWVEFELASAARACLVLAGRHEACGLVLKHRASVCVGV